MFYSGIYKLHSLTFAPHFYRSFIGMTSVKSYSSGNSCCIDTEKRLHWLVEFSLSAIDLN